MISSQNMRRSWRYVTTNNKRKQFVIRSTVKPVFLSKRWTDVSSIHDAGVGDELEMKIVLTTFFDAIIARNSYVLVGPAGKKLVLEYELVPYDMAMLAHVMES